MSGLDPALLGILACPVPTCRGKLEQHEQCLVCTKCGRRYRIEERWPVLIPEEAELPATVAPRPQEC